MLTVLQILKCRFLLLPFGLYNFFEAPFFGSITTPSPPKLHLKIGQFAENWRFYSMLLVAFGSSAFFTLGFFKTIQFTILVWNKEKEPLAKSIRSMRSFTEIIGAERQNGQNGCCLKKATTTGEDQPLNSWLKLFAHFHSWRSRFPDCINWTEYCLIFYERK